jgi:glucose/arabinose dehydrogenase
MLRYSLRLIPIFVVPILLAFNATAEEQKLLTGHAAYGDWTQDAPGVRRLITPQDLLSPKETPSAVNGPKIVPAPADAALKVPPGFKVFAFMTGLKDPRQMKIAPNGDIFLAESGGNRIRVISSAAGSEQATGATVFASNLPERPYGIAFYPPGNDPHYVYIATEGHVLRYPYHTGDLQARGNAETIIADLPQGHHWTRDVIFTADGSKMLVAVGSGSNDAEEGIDAEAWRADILEYSPDGTNKRVYASGLRNPVTLTFNPTTQALWTTVNERDGMGDNLPPDYAAHVAENGFYGWPWYYIGSHQDAQHNGQHPEWDGKVITPDILLQPHSAPLGCAFYTGTDYPAQYRGDLFIAMHGSWNRAQRTGYKLVHARFRNGKATGEYDDFLTGFVTKDGNVWGRPVGVAIAKDGAVLLSDDASGTVWKIRYTGKQ